MSSSDTNAIDEKKTEEELTNPNFKSFAYNYLYSIIVTIGIMIFIIGSLGLYTTKVAQSNILPDNIDLAPYTIFDRVVKDIPIDINVVRPSFMSDFKDCFSQKALFNSQEYLDSFNESFLCLLKKNAEPNAGIFSNAALFLSKVYDNIIAKNFTIVNSIFVSLSYFPEWFIMIVYGMFGIILWFVLWFITTCLSIVYHIINIPELFKEETAEKTNKWETDENVSLMRFTKLLLFFFIWLPLGFASTFITPFFLSIYALIAPLYAKYKIKDQNQSYNVFDFIKNTFAYKKMFFFILSSISLITNGQKYLGNNSLIGIFIAIIFAYFMGLYSNEVPSSEDGFTMKIRQNIKQAPVEELNMANPKLVQICKKMPMTEEIEELLSKNGTRNVLSYVADNNNEMTGGGKRSANYKIKLV